MAKGQFNSFDRVLLLYVNKEPDSPCWVWTGHKLRNGYGKVSINYKTVLAHRFMYEQVKGPIPKGLHIDHLCCNKLCVNPDHLEAVTPQENTRRWKATITHCKNGHPYEGNHWIYSGVRVCKICRRQWERMNYYKRKEKLIG